MCGIEVDGDASSDHCAQDDTGESAPRLRQVAFHARAMGVVHVDRFDEWRRRPRPRTQQLGDSSISDKWATVARRPQFWCSGEHRVFPRRWRLRTNHSACGRCVYDGCFGVMWSRLCCGYDLMRCILAQVVSITTDFGVESKLPVTCSKVVSQGSAGARVWAPLRRSAAESAVQHVMVSLAPDTPQGVPDGGPTPQGGYGQLTCGWGTRWGCEQVQECFTGVFRSLAAEVATVLKEQLPLLYDQRSSFPFLNKLRDAVGVGHAKTLF